jgi:hypothetical protein
VTAASAVLGAATVTAVATAATINNGENKARIGPLSDAMCSRLVGIGSPSFGHHKFAKTYSGIHPMTDSSDPY